MELLADPPSHYIIIGCSHSEFVFETVKQVTVKYAGCFGQFSYVQASGFQIPFEIWTICKPISFRPFKIRTCLDFKSPLCQQLNWLCSRWATSLPRPRFRRRSGEGQRRGLKSWTGRQTRCEHAHPDHKITKTKWGNPRKQDRLTVSYLSIWVDSKLVCVDSPCSNNW